MKYKGYVFLVFQLVTTTIFCQNPSWQWMKSSGGNSDDRADRIIVDASGNTYVTGWFFSQSIKFGSTTLTSSGGSDIFVTKYDPSGNILWAKKGAGNLDDYAYDIAIDPNGNLFITGTFKSPSITFGSLTLINTNSGYDGFLVKYDASGNVLWARGYGGTDWDNGDGVALDANGNSYITGCFYSPTIKFGSFTLVNANTSGNKADIFIVRYDSQGNVIWAKSHGGNGRGFGSDIKIDASGNLYCTGSFGGSSISFGSYILYPKGSSSSNVFIVKMDQSGTAIWARSAGGTYLDHSNSVSIDVNGNSYITGDFQSPSITFGNTTLINEDSSAFKIHSFIAKYDISGNVVWAKKIGGTGDDVSMEVSLDQSGDPYVIGYFYSPVLEFGNIKIANFDSTTNSNDIFIIKYNNAGNVLWAKSAGGVESDYGWSIVVDASGSAYISGSFDSPEINFGSGSLINSSSSDDVIVGKISNSSGIKDFRNVSNVSFRIFPNPSSNHGQINISSQLNIDQIRIINVLGQIVYEANPNRKELSCTLNSAGVYLIEVISGGQNMTEKIIVKD